MGGAKANRGKDVASPISSQVCQRETLRIGLELGRVESPNLPVISAIATSVLTPVTGLTIYVFRVAVRTGNLSLDFCIGMRSKVLLVGGVDIIAQTCLFTESGLE